MFLDREKLQPNVQIHSLFYKILELTPALRNET